MAPGVQATSGRPAWAAQPVVLVRGGGAHATGAGELPGAGVGAPALGEGTTGTADAAGDGPGRGLPGTGDALGEGVAPPFAGEMVDGGLESVGDGGVTGATGVQPAAAVASSAAAIKIERNNGASLREPARVSLMRGCSQF